MPTTTGMSAPAAIRKIQQRIPPANGSSTPRQLLQPTAQSIKECTVCGYTMATETIPATGGGEHTHSYGSEWKNDADNHWHECSCGDKADKAAHDFKWVVDKEATATQKGSSMRSARFAATRRRQLRFRLPASQQNRPILRKPTRTPAQKARKPVTTAI